MPGAANCSRFAPSCGSFLPVLNNPVVVIPGLRAGTCAVLRGNLMIVFVCHLSNKELLYFTLLYAYRTANLLGLGLPRLVLQVHFSTTKVHGLRGD